MGARQLSVKGGSLSARPDSFGFYVLDKDGLVFGNNCEPIWDVPEEPRRSFLKESLSSREASVQQPFVRDYGPHTPPVKESVDVPLGVGHVRILSDDSLTSLADQPHSLLTTFLFILTIALCLTFGGLPLLSLVLRPSIPCVSNRLIHFEAHELR